MEQKDGRRTRARRGEAIGRGEEERTSHHQGVGVHRNEHEKHSEDERRDSKNHRNDGELAVLGNLLLAMESISR